MSLNESVQFYTKTNNRRLWENSWEELLLVYP